MQSNVHSSFTWGSFEVIFGQHINFILSCQFLHSIVKHILVRIVDCEGAVFPLCDSNHIFNTWWADCITHCCYFSRWKPNHWQTHGGVALHSPKIDNGQSAKHTTSFEVGKSDSLSRENETSFVFQHQYRCYICTRVARHVRTTSDSCDKCIVGKILSPLGRRHQHTINISVESITRFRKN